MVPGDGRRENAGVKICWPRRVARFGLVVLAGLLPATLAAQGATPAATPDIPAATECTIDPLEPMDLLALAQGGVSSDLLEATPIPEASLPDGPPANEEEMEGITATVRELVACANAREPLRLVALLTDDFKIALAGAALGLQGEAPEDLEARFPVPIALEDIEPIEEVAMIPVRDGRLLVDGRVAAILEPTVEGIDQPLAFYVTFELVDGRWLIDDLTIIEPAEEPGTPTP